MKMVHIPNGAIQVASIDEFGATSGDGAEKLVPFALGIIYLTTQT